MTPSIKTRKLIDTFLFFNEIEMLKARLEYLGPVVDHFVICEANIDFAGNKKKIILNEMIQFVTLANNRSDRFNGATYILIALCMVSKEAYEELPEWLRYTF